jgi:lipopolysaccharide/colanic/teichoic acid biosynthesis glycosyltransferase
LNGSAAPRLDIPIVSSSKFLHEYILRNPLDILVVPATPSIEICAELLEPILEIGLTLAVPDGVTVNFGPSIQERLFTRRAALLGTEMTLITTNQENRNYLFAKRLVDTIVSFCGLICLAPVFLTIALIIKICAPKDPVFYPWRVLGKNGRPFVGYKFRTMVPDADKLKERLREFNEMQGPAFKMRNDPRILPFGRLLRKFSLDELPQLYSVLKGDMSLVGPRPPSREEVERFEFWQRRKLSVKPGITCLWQINGRNEICAFDDWARLDIEYIENASLILDLKILLLTVPAVLSGRGAS